MPCAATKLEALNFAGRLQHVLQVSYGPIWGYCC